MAAATDDAASDMDLPRLPRVRAMPATDADRAADRSSADASRPERTPAEGGDAYTVASLPQTRPADAAFPTSPEEIIPEAKATDPTMLSYAGDAAHGARQPRSRHRPDIGGQVRGQDDGQVGARRPRKDAKREAKPVVVAAQPQAARWAFDSSYVACNASTKAPSFAHNLVRAAPSEVYTAGFQQGTAGGRRQPRFTGKAVTFMTIARFSTN